MSEKCEYVSGLRRNEAAVNKPPRTRITVSIIGGLLIAGMVLGVTIAISSSSLQTAQPEVIPTAEQQKLILDLLAEKKRLEDQKQAEISGAVRMLMSQLTDPITKQVGLDTARWTPTQMEGGGLKFIQIPQTPPGQQPAPEASTPPSK